MYCKALSSVGTEQYAAMLVVAPIIDWQIVTAAAAIQHMDVSTATQGNQEKAMQELAGWLQNCTPSRSLGSCIPEIVIVYLVD